MTTFIGNIKFHLLNKVVFQYNCKKNEFFGRLSVTISSENKLITDVNSFRIVNEII